MQRESTGDMQTLTTHDHNCIDLPGHQSGVLALKEVLSIRLPSFIAAPGEFWATHLTRRTQSKKLYWPRIDI
jgi:hypothetical protein